MPFSPLSSERKYNTAGIASWLLLFVGLAPWLISEWRASLDENVSWLLIGAQRLLQGGTMLNSVFDPNPPLNVLIYAPAVIFTHALHLPVWRSLFLYMAALTVFAAMLVWQLAGLMPGKNNAWRQAVTASFLVAGTVFFHLIWGEREQFIYLFLFPLALAQSLITAGIAIPRRLKYTALIPGAAAILIKPHFILIPIAILIHRSWKRKSILAVAGDTDVIVMVLCALAYLALLLIFFHDYLFIMMPDVVHFYLQRRHFNQALAQTCPFIPMGIVLTLLTLALNLPRDNRCPIFQLVALFGLSLLAFLAQEKGLSYQMTPAVCFLGLAIGLFFFELARRFVGDRAGALPGIAAVLAFTYMLTIFPPRYPDNNGYAELPFSRYVAAHATNGVFYVYMDNMGMAPEIALYTGLTNGSRFPSLWFLAALLESGNKKDFDHFSGYIGEDFKKWQPSLLLLQRHGYIHAQGKNDFDFMTYFRTDRGLNAILARYKRIETKSFVTSDYFGGVPPPMSDKMIFDVYERRP